MIDTPYYFVTPATPWDDWDATYFANGKFCFVCSKVPLVADWKPDFVESIYPGISSAYNALSGLGCDAYLITHVLKYCALYSDEARLDDFLKNTLTLKAVEASLAIGLSGNELVEFWSNSLSNTKAPAVSLPTEASIGSDR